MSGNETPFEEFLFAEPASLAATIFLGVYCSVLVLLTTFVCVMVLIRRHHRFIVARDMLTLIPHMVYNCATSIVVSVSIVLGKPAFCGTLNIVLTILTVLSHRFNLYIPHIVYQAEINDLKVSRAQELKEGTSGSASNHQAWKMIKYFSAPLRVLYLFIIAVIQGAVVAVVWYFADLPGDCLRPSLLVNAAVILLICIFISYFLVKFSKVKDPFFYRFEADIAAVLMLGHIFILITYPIFPQMYYSWFDVRWVLVLNPFNITMNGVFPVLLTIDRFRVKFERFRFGFTGTDLVPKNIPEDEDALSIKGAVNVFKAVLENDFLRAAFTKFATSEWSVENVLFYTAVEEYRALDDPVAREIRGNMIINEFVLPSAPMEVNLEHTVRTAIIEAAGTSVTSNILGSTTVRIHKNSADSKRFDPNLFNAAQHRIFILMESDTFAKWRRTQNFKETVLALSKNRTASGSNSGSFLSRSLASKGTEHQVHERGIDMMPK